MSTTAIAPIIDTTDIMAICVFLGGFKEDGIGLLGICLHCQLSGSVAVSQ